MCRKLALAATALSLAAASPALAIGFGRKADKAPEAAPAQPAAPARASPAERAQAERLDPLARATFWASEFERDGTDAEAGVKLAASLRLLGQYDEAGRAAQQVLVLQPNNLDALLETARAHIASGRGFYAIEPLRTAQAAAPRDWRPLSLLGVAYDQTSRPAEAEAAWTQALALSPDNPAVLSNLALHKAAAGDPAGAETLLRRAVARPDATIKERQNLVLVLGMQGKLAEAEQLARQDLPPELVENNLAYLRAVSSGGARTWQSVAQSSN